MAAIGLAAFILGVVAGTTVIAPKTLVELRPEPATNGTRLVITESGFDSLPDDPRRIDALRSNAQGWDLQAVGLAAHVEA
ncbi:MAG TPA: hypothetical protein VKZ91_05150 [Woeseiaceae bacterium]|nr:hypothetical protein [Woeseiaceae bacterium]